MESEIPEFGPFMEGVNYILRPGAYAIVYNDTRQVAVIRTSAGLYLPGGGIEGNESPEEALLRETQEECGMVVRIEQQLGIADQLISLITRNLFIRKRGIFFTASVERWNHAAQCEDDHELLWLAQDEAVARLVHESQRYMVIEAGREH